MLVTVADARRIIAAAYPDMQFRITTKCTIGCRPVYDPAPTLVWTKLDRGSDSVVRIGRLLPGNDIDWNYSNNA